MGGGSFWKMDNTTNSYPAKHTQVSTSECTQVCYLTCGGVRHLHCWLTTDGSFQPTDNLLKKKKNYLLVFLTEPGNSVRMLQLHVPSFGHCHPHVHVRGGVGGVGGGFVSCCDP